MRLVMQLQGTGAPARAGERREVRLRPPPPQGPWLSRRDWRRAMDIAIRRGLSRAERRELMSRLARVRGGAEGSPPRLRVLEGGAPVASGAASPRSPGAREAA